MGRGLDPYFPTFFLFLYSLRKNIFEGLLSHSIIEDRMVANKGFQKHNIQKLLEKKGIFDFDLEAEVDPTLSMSENIDNIERRLGISLRDDGPKNSKAAREQSTGFDKRQARDRHEQRPQKNQLIDESLNAEETFDFPLQDGEFETWAENPDEYDIEGIDTRLF